MKELYSFFAFDRESYEKVKTVAWKENWKILHFFSGLFTVVFAILTVVSFFSASVSRNLHIYAAYGVYCLIYAAVSAIRTPVSMRVKEVLVYSFIASLLMFGIILGTVLFRESVTVSFVILLIAVPLLFTVRTFVMNMIVLSSVVVYLVLAFFMQERSVFVSSFLNVLPCGILSIFVTSAIMRTKLQRIMLQDEKIILEHREKLKQDQISTYEDFITDMVRYASLEENPEKVIKQLVQYIGEKLHSDRAYIFEENDKGTFDNTYEWCREGVTKQIENLQHVPYEGIVEVWYNQYRRSRNIIVYDLESYREKYGALYELLKSQGINTLVSGPIIMEGNMIGFYGVDNPPKEALEEISELIDMVEFVVAFMIRLRNNAKKLEYSATHDPLTGCKNREALDWLYEKQLDIGKSLAVLMCDLNGLKEVNDKQGHDAGDRFIKKTAQILKDNFGEEHVYRMGGDEFIAVLTEVTREEFEEKVETTRTQLGLSVSSGRVYQESMDDSFDAILKVADTEMYIQKKEYYEKYGRNRRTNR